MDRLLLRAEEFAKRMGISRSLFYKLNAAGKIGPMPIRSLGPPLWKSKEADAWVHADCPPREQWQKMIMAEAIKF